MTAPTLSQVRCLYFAEDNGFEEIRDSLSPDQLPALIYASQPDLSPALRIDASLLAALMKGAGLDSLLTTVHLFKPDAKKRKKKSVEAQVKELLSEEEQWKPWMGKAYDEGKDWISIGLALAALV